MMFQWTKLHSSIDKIRQDSGSSWRNLGKGVGITPSIFTRISQGKPVSVKNLLLLLKIIESTALVDSSIWDYVKGK